MTTNQRNGLCALAAILLFGVLALCIRPSQQRETIAAPRATATQEPAIITAETGIESELEVELEGPPLGSVEVGPITISPTPSDSEQPMRGVDLTELGGVAGGDPRCLSNVAPLPYAKIWNERPAKPGMKATPVNVQVVFSDGAFVASVGCGVYPATGKAYCQASDRDNRDTPRRFTTTVEAFRLNPMGATLVIADYRSFSFTGAACPLEPKP